MLQKPKVNINIICYDTFINNIKSKWVIIMTAMFATNICLRIQKQTRLAFKVVSTIDFVNIVFWNAPLFSFRFIKSPLILVRKTVYEKHREYNNKITRS